MNREVAEVLKQHFEVAFGAADGVARLRELILTLAMQGKLVEQDPDDPPASELLKEIEGEKRRLVGEGKIKMPKVLPPVTVGEVPYEVPKGWEWVRLGDLIHLEMGQSPSSEFYNRKNDGLPFFQGKADFGSLHPIPRYWCTNPQKLAFANDVLLSVRAPVGPTNIANVKCCIGRGLAALRPLAGMDAKFLNLLMIRFRLALEEKATGTTFVAVSKTDIENLLVLAIPLPEQHRIVARIDQLMARCDELEKLRKAREENRLAVHAAAIKQLVDVPDSSAWNFLQAHFGELYTVKENVAELRKAILQLAVMGRLVPQDPNDPPASELLKEIEGEKQRLFGEGKIKMPKVLPPVTAGEVPYEVPTGWEWVRLGEICNGITSGTTPPKNIFNEKHGIPFLKVYNIRNQRIDFQYKSQFIDPEYHQKKMLRSKLIPGDVVMNIVGPPLGKTAIIPDDYPEYNCNQAIVVLRPFAGEINKYIYSYLLAGTFLEGIELVGTAGQDNISVTKSQMMPIPPLSEQHRIVARIDQLMALCDTLDHQINAATNKQTPLLNAVMAQV